jgi:hypothetical protein
VSLVLTAGVAHKCAHKKVPLNWENATCREACSHRFEGHFPDAEYGQFVGLALDDEPHQHDGNDALHYDLAWGDFTSGIT